MANSGEIRADDTDQPSTPRPAEVTRDAAGRFAAGHARLGGRRRGQSISAELRRQISPEEVAAHIVALIRDPRTNARERLQALALIADRTEGKAVSRSISVQSSASLLPAGFDSWPIEARRAALLDIRARALAGNLITDGGDDGSDDE